MNLYKALTIDNYRIIVLACLYLVVFLSALSLDAQASSQFNLGEMQTGFNQPPNTYLVKTGDTSWSLAVAMRPNINVSVAQVMTALLKLNPESFVNENINGLKLGYYLRVPDINLITAINKVEANTFVREHMLQWHGSSLIQKKTRKSRYPVYDTHSADSVVVDDAHESLDKTAILSSEDELFDVNKLQLGASLYHRNFSNEDFLNDSTFALFEADYFAGDTELALGISYQNFTDSNLMLSHISINQYHGDFDYKIGKFVTKVGVLDYLSTINTFNLSRFEYYDEANSNVRYIPAWMLLLNWYPDDEATLSLIIQPHDNDNKRLLNSSIQFGLNSTVPYLLTHTGNKDIDLIGNQILLPIYDEQFKQVATSYIDSKVQDESATLDNTSVGINYIANKEGYTYGVLLLNAYSEIPLVILDDDLLDVVENLDEKDKLPFIQNYLETVENEPIKSIEHFRYNQLGLYYESSLNSFGVRGELSYRDRFPLLNETTEMFNLGLGLDHKGYMYNNIEMQIVTFSKSDLTAKYIIWMSQFDPARFGHWDIQFKNILTHADYSQYAVTANLSRLIFQYNTLALSLEYLAHSRQDYISNTASIYMKVIF